MNLCTLSECESWHGDGLCVCLIVFHKLWRSSLIMYLFLRERLCEGVNVLCFACFVKCLGTGSGDSCQAASRSQRYSVKWYIDKYI